MRRQVKKNNRRAHVAGGLSANMSAYHGASTTSRDVATWQPYLGSADADILPDLDMLRSRTRDINRNSPVAQSGTQTIVDNVVGTGLRLVPKPNYRALGKTKEWADEFSEQVTSEWVQFAESTECHAGNTMTFDQISALVLRAQITNGESVSLPLWLPKTWHKFSTKIQIFESDRLSTPDTKIGDPSIRKGVKRDKFGAPIGYYIRKSHPGDAYLLTGNTGVAEWEYVPRYTSFGRLRVLHVFDPQRSEQTRGVPLISSVLPQFKNSDRYVQAELQAAIVNAMVAMVIETPLEQEAIVEMFKGDPVYYNQERRNYALPKIRSGGVVPIMPGDKVTPFTPARPAAQFGNFLENIYRMIAIAHDLPYELLMKDFSKTTYSSARAAMLEAWRSFLRRRDWLATQWADPIYSLFLEEVINSGRIKAPDFYDNKTAYTRCRWIGPARGWVDPVKEAQAMVIRLENGVSTLEEECAAQGLEWKETTDQRAFEIAYWKEKGLPIPVGKNYTFPSDEPANNQSQASNTQQ